MPLQHERGTFPRVDLGLCREISPPVDFELSIPNELLHLAAPKVGGSVQSQNVCSMIVSLAEILLPMLTSSLFSTARHTFSYFTPFLTDGFISSKG